jgi:hypothetical protein
MQKTLRNHPPRKPPKAAPPVWRAPTTTSTSMASNDVDYSFINELYEEIERRPPAIEARKLLVETYLAAGWTDAVADAVQELKTLCSADAQVNQWHAAFCLQTQAPPAPKAKATKHSTYKPSTSSKGKSRSTFVQSSNPPIAAAVLPSDPTELASEKQKLITSYREFRQRAKTLLRDRHLLLNLRAKKGLPVKHDDYLQNLELLGDGKITTTLRNRDVNLPTGAATARTSRPPDSAREAARKMKADPKKAFDIGISDLETMIKWLQETQPISTLNNDSLREAIAKRVRLMIAALPQKLHIHASEALMHIEHELQWKKYVNDETMYGDAVPDIPRENFYCTEDGYAWDMEELSQAITSNKGVMRNPLSKHMFTPGDIKAILQHPLGQSLAALGVEQHKLKQGVRPKTLEEMDRMANVLMEDMAEDAMKSRMAVDEFLAYIATLPEAEQNAIDNLRVQAKDSHTGQAFDGTIGEAVRDAKANRLCFHKAGKWSSDYPREMPSIGSNIWSHELPITLYISHAHAISLSCIIMRG